MRKRMTLLFALATVLVLATACAQPSSSTGTSSGAASSTAAPAGQTVSGFVNTKSGTPLPAGATLTVELHDNSNPDPAAATLGTQTVDASGKTSPIDFAIPYDLSKVNPNDLVAVEATITAGGSTLFVNKGQTLVITQGRPTTGVGVVMQAP